MLQKTLKLYGIVRKDLSRSQQAVQCSHAIAQYLLEHKNLEWDNGTIVLLKADLQEINFLKQNLKQYSEFYEPDIGNQLTAIATVGYDLFPDLQLI